MLAEEYELSLETLVTAKGKEMNFVLLSIALQMKNAALAKLASLQMQVSCKACGCIHEAELVKKTLNDFIENNERCPKCNAKNQVVAKPRNILYSSQG